MFRNVFLMYSFDLFNYILNNSKFGSNCLIESKHCCLVDVTVASELIYYFARVCFRSGRAEKKID